MRKGFSLVELSIVLVILGLLTGGILAGQSLIRASELRGAATGYNRYVTAAQTFRDKYFAIPGDFKDATRFWGRQTGNADCATNSGAAGPNANGACDGNGDGSNGIAGAASQSSEQMQFWRHLALAGLIEGTYSGHVGSGSYAQGNADNLPASKVNSGYWATGHWNNIPGGNPTVYALDFGNYLLLGALTSSDFPWNPLLRPEEAWNIDTKVDDGKPARGKLIVAYWNNACAAADDGSHADNDFNASYRLSDNSLQCALQFIKLW